MEKFMNFEACVVLAAFNVLSGALVKFFLYYSPSCIEKSCFLAVYLLCGVYMIFYFAYALAFLDFGRLFSKNSAYAPKKLDYLQSLLENGAFQLTFRLYALIIPQIINKVLQKRKKFLTCARNVC